MPTITPRKRAKLLRTGLNKIRARHAKTAETRQSANCAACLEAVRRLNVNVAAGIHFRF